MTEAQTALSRRAVACKGWRWMPGMVMLWLSGEVGGFSSWARPMSVSDDGSVNWWEGDPPTEEADGVWRDKAIPDLTDAATVGCLLALVREAWRCPTVYVRQSTTRRVSDGVIAWEVCDLWLDAEACRALGVDRQGSVGSWGHASEAEALVAALEGAP